VSAIYSLATVNHDHILATILRLMPSRAVNCYDLRQRAYLAATLKLKDFGVYFHRSSQSESAPPAGG
jgi:hypothetical protein